MAEKKIEVHRPQYTYTRTLRSRVVTFVCKCHPAGPKLISEERMPGPLPVHCLTCENDGSYKRYRAETNLKRYYELKRKEVQPTP